MSGAAFGGIVLSESWAERIPAAIEKAEGLRGIPGTVSRTEVVLAKALWAVLLNEGYGEGQPEHAEAALRAFVEKVESL